MVGQRAEWRAARRGRWQPPRAQRDFEIKLVPNTGSAHYARSLRVARNSTWDELLLRCAERLGSSPRGNFGDLSVALCRAQDGQPVETFNALGADAVHTVLFAGARWRPPPTPPHLRGAAFDASLLGSLEGVVRVSADDPELPALLRAAVPVVITGGAHALIPPSVRAKWITGGYLGAQLDAQPNSGRFSVSVASAGYEPPRHAYFDFIDPVRTSGQYVCPAPPQGVCALYISRDHVPPRPAAGRRGLPCACLWMRATACHRVPPRAAACRRAPPRACLWMHPCSVPAHARLCHTTRRLADRVCPSLPC